MNHKAGTLKLSLSQLMIESYDVLTTIRRSLPSMSSYVSVSWSGTHAEIERKRTKEAVNLSSSFLLAYDSNRCQSVNDLRIE